MQINKIKFERNFLLKTKDAKSQNECKMQRTNSIASTQLEGWKEFNRLLEASLRLF